MSYQVFRNVLNECEVNELMTKATGLSWTKGASGFYWRSTLVQVSEDLMTRITELFNVKRRTTNARLLRMEKGSSLRPHVDNFLNGRYQVLVMLNPALEGGILHLDGIGPVPTLSGDAVGFDANRTKHWVTEVEEGERLVLSIWYFLR